jgi:hypothetical protein
MSAHPPPIPPIGVRPFPFRRARKDEYGAFTLDGVHHIVEVTEMVPLALDPAQPCRVGGGE